MIKEDQMRENEEIKKALLSKAEISLILDEYDDIFSDFDPRPFSIRALSDDFLLEAKKAAIDKNESLELHFLIPRKEKDISLENIIKKRLKDHFKKHSLILENEIRRIKRKGFFMAFIGIVFILIATILISLNSSNFFIHFFIVLLEPAGWFTAWTGLDEIYYSTKQRKPDYKFYKKMEIAEITFTAY